MAFTPVEWLAVIIAVLGAIKLIVILVKPLAWFNTVVKKVFAKPVITGTIALVLASISLIYLLEELTIVQIFGVMFFFSMLMLVSIASYSKEMMQFATKIYHEKDIIKKGWFSILIWIALLVWVLTVLF